MVGVVSLLLVVPLNILSNTLTPKVQRWWGTTAQRRAANRFKAIHDELKLLDNYDLYPIDPIAELIKAMAIAILSMMFLIIGIVVLTILSPAWLPENMVLPDTVISKKALALLGLLFMVVGMALNLFSNNKPLANSPYLTVASRGKRRGELMKEYKELYIIFPHLVDNPSLSIPNPNNPPI